MGSIRCKLRKLDDGWFEFEARDLVTGDVVKVAGPDEESVRQEMGNYALTYFNSEGKELEAIIKRARKKREDSKSVDKKS